MAEQGKFTRRALMGGAALLTLGGASLAFRGVANHGFTASGADPRVLNRGNGAEPDTLDPHKASGAWEGNIIGDMFMGLMTEDAAGNPVPGAAESYRVSADGLTYTFRIRDHKWSDGAPVTADDFVFSLRRIADPRTAAQYVSILYPLANMQAAAQGNVLAEKIGARALDARTLELSFRFQVPYIAELLCHFAAYPVPRHVVEAHGDGWMRPEHIATNGPYTLKSWVPNDRVVLTANPHFHDKARLALDTVVFYPTQDAAAALKRFRGGEFDLVSNSIPPQQVDWLRAHLPRELHLTPFDSTVWVQFNLKRKPFDDVRVRTALSMAIDREVLTSRVLRAGERPAYSAVPPGMPGYPHKARLPFKSLAMPARVAKAKALMAAAGYGPQNPLSFEFSTHNTTESKIAAVGLQEMWREVGANVRIVPSETQIFYDLLRKRDFAVGWSGWIADYRDPKNYLFLFQASTPELNYGSYSNPRYDGLIAQSDTLRDPRRRMEVLEQAEQILLDDAVIAPVYTAVTRNLVSPQIKGWIDNNANVNRSRYLSLDRSITSA